MDNTQRRIEALDLLHKTLQDIEEKYGLVIIGISASWINQCTIGGDTRHTLRSVRMESEYWRTGKNEQPGDDNEQVGEDRGRSTC